MKTNELMIKKENELTQQQLRFVAVHENILNAGAMITNSVISLAKNLKIMRDDKLYIEAECNSFEEYAEEICGLKRSQAYAYIQAVEKLGEEFVQSTGQIGITKLSLLANLSGEEREKIIETVAIEDVSVSKLKEEIKGLRQELAKKDEQITDFDMSSIEIDNLKQELEKLKEDLKKEKSKPAKVVTEVREDVKSKEKIKELEEKLKRKTEEFNSANEKFVQSTGQVASLKKQLELASDVTMIEFKVKFNNLQILINEISSLIEKVPLEKKEGCKNALKKVVEVLC